MFGGGEELAISMDSGNRRSYLEEVGEGKKFEGSGRLAN
jgi:hypothetical protein